MSTQTKFSGPYMVLDPLRLKNSFFTWQNKTSLAVSLRKRDLLLNLKREFQRNKLYIKRAGGSRPNIAVERGLTLRITNAGYKFLLMRKIKIGKPDFSRALRSSIIALRKPVVDKVNNYKLFSACKNVLVSLGLNKKLRPTSMKFATLLLNKPASAGFPFTGSKGVNIDRIYKMANLAWKQKLEGRFKYFPNMCAFRLQLRGTMPKISVKFRVMYPYPGALTLIEQRYLFPIVQHFAKRVGSTFYTLGMRGIDTTNWLRKRFKNKFEKGEIVISLDVSAWDQNLSVKLISAAFWIIQTCFNLTSIERKIFVNQMLHFIVSYNACVYQKKPFMFVKEHGIPSGSSWTNLIGTIIHAIISEYIEPGVLEKGNILLCSDDNIKQTKMSLPQLQTAYKQFGLEISEQKSSVYKDWRDVEFLGYKWVNGLRHINVSLALNQMVYHSQFIVDLDKYQRELARSASILLTGVNGQHVFRRLFPDVINQLESGVDVRFNYLYGYGNPVTNPNIVNKTSTFVETSNNVSLRESLYNGHLIR